MVNTDQDEERMYKWRQALGPDKKPYREDQ